MCDQTNSEDTTDTTKVEDNIQQHKTSDIIFIEKILSNEILKRKVEMWHEEGTINLIQPEWKSVLYNNPTFQKHKSNQVEYNLKHDANKHYVRHTLIRWDDHFNILVVGLFRVIPANGSTNSCIMVYNCAPISEIGKVMAGENCLDNPKFYVDTCGGICPKCRSDPTVPNDNEWCVQNTQVFSKEGFNPATRHYVEQTFRSPTLGIAVININMKYDFSKMSKVGGKIKSICFVKESLLRPEEEYNERVLTLDAPVFAVPQKRKLEENNSVLALPNDRASTEEYQVKTMKM